MKSHVSVVIALSAWNELRDRPFMATDLEGIADWIGEGATSAGPLGSGPASAREIRAGLEDTYPGLSEAQITSFVHFVLAFREV